MTTQPTYIPIIATGVTNYNLAQGMAEWQLLPIDQLNIVCDSTNGVINIQLPKISDLRGKLGFKIIIADVAGAAETNNINILVGSGSGDKINFNSASLALNANYGMLELVQTRNNQSTDNGNWGALYPVVLNFGNLSPLFTVAQTKGPFLPTIAFTAINQNANLVYAGPASGGAAAPAFRALTLADMPGGLGSGTVTSFSSGNLSPLFTTNVATATTTPALSFSLTSQEVNYAFIGPYSGSPGAPSWRLLKRNDMSLNAAATLDFPNTNPGSVADLTMNVPGAVADDSVFLGVPNSAMTTAGSTSLFFAWVSAANTVTVRFCNVSTVGGADPPSGTFTATILRA